MLYSLHAIALALIFALSPSTPVERAEELADGFTAATEDVDELLELAVTAWHEGQFRLDVQTCRVRGDGGRALTLFQLHRHWRGGFSDRDVCGTLSLQAQLALRALRSCRGSGTPRRAFARYTGRRLQDAEVSRRVATLARLRRLVEGYGGS
jgi:hypothetical protein